jgi:hypothetical protein
MAAMRRIFVPMLLLCLGASVAAAAPLEHRVWLLDGVPPAETLDTLRAIGVDGLVVPVGSVALTARGSDFSLASLPGLHALGGWRVTPLVWVEGSGDAAGDAAAFLAQVAPARRLLPSGGAGVMLAARTFWPGLPRFVEAVGKNLRGPVELVLPVGVIAQQLPAQGWPGVEPVAVVFGNPEALGWPASTIHDDLAALEVLDRLPVSYRAAIVVRPRANPRPGPQPVSLASLSSGTVANYKPGARGDVFVLKRAVSWGGVPLAMGQSVEVDVVQTSRYQRDLGLLLRPARGRLLGWDTVSLPPPAPALGMSLEAFVDYFSGGMPDPSPRVSASWSRRGLLEVGVENDSPHGSAVATTGNWIEVSFTGAVVADVEPGEFAGFELGRDIGSRWTVAVSGDADAVRLFLPYLAPDGRVGGAMLRFVGQPQALESCWGMRLGDGSTRSGARQALELKTR